MDLEADVMRETWCIVVEHPEFGMARVWMRWAAAGRDTWKPVPFGVEFDLFTPLKEQELLLADLKTYASNLRAEVNRVRVTRPATTPGAPKLS